MLSLGDLMYFNADNGYLEGIVRGFKSTLLSQQQYTNLTQCEHLDDFRMQLCATEYNEQFQNIAQDGRIRSSDFGQGCLDRLVQEFKHIRAGAVDPQLVRFLDLMSFNYMIDNIILLITGTLNQRDVKNELLDRCHPLGMFDSLPALTVCTTTAELYNLCIVDTPLAPYFESIADLDEMNIEIIRNTLYRAYLEDFHAFCSQLGGASSAMVDMLEFEADRRTITITLNSMNTELSRDEKLKLYPKVGRLFPDGHQKLARCEDFESVKSVCEMYSEFRPLFDQAGGSVLLSDQGATLDFAGGLDAAFFAKEVEMHKLSFMEQFHFGVFYSYFKLREQETRNIVWIAECISQGQRDKINGYVSIF